MEFSNLDLTTEPEDEGRFDPASKTVSDVVKDAAIKFQPERDAQLAMPKLMTRPLHVNMRAGEIPSNESGALMLMVTLNGL